MPVSPDGILEATFDPAWAAVRLIVDGGMWSDTVDTITITRSVPSEATVPLRGVESRSVTGGYYVGSDHEMPLGVPVTYTVTGYGSGVLVESATVTVTTTGAANGLWVKVAGKPDLTTLVRLRTVGEARSDTIGGVYQIAGGGGAVAQTMAHWSGIESDRAIVGTSALNGTERARLQAAFAASRVLLLQAVGSTDLDDGWYFVESVVRSNPAGSEHYARRWFSLTVQRTGVPVGQGSGIAGNSWATLMDSYDTWADVLAAYDTWFDVLKGA